MAYSKRFQFNITGKILQYPDLYHCPSYAIHSHGLHHPTKRACRRNVWPEGKRISTLLSTYERMPVNVQGLLHVQNRTQNISVLEVRLNRSKTNKLSEHIPISYRYLLSDILYKLT
jgi:hypothetical protein